MADYKKFDPRLESLVVETRTNWADDVGELSEQDKTWVSQAIHRRPELAGQIYYERSHTGFTREITVTAADVARLYDAEFKSQEAAAG